MYNYIDLWLEFALQLGEQYDQCPIQDILTNTILEFNSAVI